jgi:acyl phosphate:glycerol-3-phosphate acyltransferase
MATLLAVLAAYLIGSISFAVIASRMFRLPDPRTYGSGNPGATNVLRSGKKAAALVTLLGDAAKGAAAVALVRWQGPSVGLGQAALAGAALAAFCGHLYPLYFGFKGGKGVATAFGVVLALSGWLALAALAIFVLVVAATRYVSLASMLGAWTAAALAPALFGFGWVAASVAAMAALIVWRHRGNVARLLAGEETRLGASKTALPPTGQA